MSSQESSQEPTSQLPSQFQSNTLSVFGNELGSQIIEAMSKPSTTVSIRLNPNSTTDNYNPQFELSSKIPWCENAFYLDVRPNFKDDPDFQNGCYYPQESSSMVVNWLVNQLLKTNVIDFALDLCASPGGKSQIVADCIASNNGLLISNEVEPFRNQTLVSNMLKWNNDNVICTRHKADQFADGINDLKEFFDLILVDAPCSGEGMFRKEPQALEHWSPKNIEICANRQKQILFDVFDSLKVGGHIIYSTCTLNKSENEDIINWLTSTLPTQIVQFENLPEDSEHQFLTLQDGCYRLIPPFSKGEGFFCCVVLKLGNFQRDENYEDEQQLWKQLKGRKLKNDFFKRQKQVKNVFHVEKKQQIINAFQELHPEVNFHDKSLICVNSMDYFLIKNCWLEVFMDRLSQLKITKHLIPLGSIRARDLKTIKKF